MGWSWRIRLVSCCPAPHSERVQRWAPHSSSSGSPRQPEAITSHPAIITNNLTYILHQHCQRRNQNACSSQESLPLDSPAETTWLPGVWFIMSLLKEQVSMRTSGRYTFTAMHCGNFPPKKRNMWPSENHLQRKKNPKNLTMSTVHFGIMEFAVWK